MLAFWLTNLLDVACQCRKRCQLKYWPPELYLVSVVVCGYWRGCWLFVVVMWTLLNRQWMLPNGNFPNSQIPERITSLLLPEGLCLFSMLYTFIFMDHLFAESSTVLLFNFYNDVGLMMDSKKQKGSVWTQKNFCPPSVLLSGQKRLTTLPTMQLNHVQEMQVC